MQMHSFLILCWYILSIVHRVLGLSWDLQDSTFSKILQGKNIKITLCFSSVSCWPPASLLSSSSFLHLIVSRLLPFAQSHHGFP